MGSYGPTVGLCQIENGFFNLPGQPAKVYFHALADLMDLFAGPVDLVRIEEAMPSLLERIREEGQVL